MTNQCKLLVAFFDSDLQAEQGARRLSRWTHASRAASLRGLGVLVKEEDGSLTRRRLGPREARKGAALGFVAGAGAAVATGNLTLLRGAVLGAAGGGTVGSLFHRKLYVSPAEIDRIREKLEPGHAAVGALVPVREAPAVAEKLEEFGGVAEPEPALAGTSAAD